MSSTSLVQSTNNMNLTRTTANNQQPQSQSPAAKTKNALTNNSVANAITPQKAFSSPSRVNNASPAISTPGRWQHPRMDEIVRRQNASCFNPADSRVVFLNAAVLIFTFFAQLHISSIPIRFIRTTPYTNYALHTAQLLLLINIALTLLPLFRRPDACEDIPLTPQQRHALGLPPMSRPATPQEQAQYVTPPRYSRSATPRSSIGSAGSFADSLRVQARGSPLSGRGSPLDASVVQQSPFGSAARRGSVGGSGSPFSASPLKDRNNQMFNTSDMGRRGSFGSPRGSPLGASNGGDVFDNAFASPGAKSGRASVGLNSKWLYQKGRPSPNGMGKGGNVNNGWGTGSVFN